MVTKSHVKFWAPNRQAELFQSVAGQRRHQAILCRNNAGCGFFGVAFRSDAAARFDALEDNQIAADHASLVEVLGCNIQSSAAVGVFLYGSTESYVEGNYVHHTWADHIHHTNGARQSWVWNNFIFNDQVSKGDDGVACVTYGPTSTRCADMEWWRNTHLGSGWGRGYAVIGGDDINIHHNWAIGVAGAGLIVASEPAYDSASSQRITLANNFVYRCAHTVGHPGILISGQNTAAQPLDTITLANNVSAETVTGTAYRAEGAYTNVTNTGLATTAAALPSPIPTMADIRIADTSILRTRDVTHVDSHIPPRPVPHSRAPGAVGRGLSAAVRVRDQGRPGCRYRLRHHADCSRRRSVRAANRGRRRLRAAADAGSRRRARHSDRRSRFGTCARAIWRATCRGCGSAWMRALTRRFRNSTGPVSKLVVDDPTTDKN